MRRLLLVLIAGACAPSGPCPDGVRPAPRPLRRSTAGGSEWLGGLAAQDFSGDPLRTGDRAVDRRVLAI